MNVTVTLSNNAASLTDAYGVNLVLPFPANVSNVLSVTAFPPPAVFPVINANNVTISAAQLPIGTTFTYVFAYDANVIPASYQWSGAIQTASYNTNTNVNLSDTITLV